MLRNNNNGNTLHQLLIVSAANPSMKEQTALHERSVCSWQYPAARWFKRGAQWKLSQAVLVQPILHALERRWINLACMKPHTLHRESGAKINEKIVVNLETHGNNLFPPGEACPPVLFLLQLQYCPASRPTLSKPGPLVDPIIFSEHGLPRIFCSLATHVFKLSPKTPLSCKCLPSVRCETLTWSS